MAYARTSERAGKRALRETMREMGLSHREIAAGPKDRRRDQMIYYQVAGLAGDESWELRGLTGHERTASDGLVHGLHRRVLQRTGRP
jgi:hypothetical protein